MNWTIPEIKPPSLPHQQAAQARQNQLTKPLGSLGQLESLAIRLASLQSTEYPSVDRAWISLFAADHGVAEEGVSAFPQSVTRLMLDNFVQGGAAISVLAKLWGAHLEVVDVGVASSTPIAGVINAKIAAGTANFTQTAAMTPSQLDLALLTGADAAQRAALAKAQLFIGGEMGIANTTAAAALACGLLAASPRALAGPGTGLDAEGVHRKIAVITQALALHQAFLAEPLEILRRLGGFEIAALTGAYLQAAALGVPILVDGYICSVAALVAVKLEPKAAAWLIFAHRSAEPGHQKVLESLQAQPLLDLSMRLGEASGAALALPILRTACALHKEMATFAEAGIPGG